VKSLQFTILLSGLALVLVGCNTPTRVASSPAPNGRLLCDRKAFRVTQTESKIIVQNIWRDPVAIRISWDNCDPWGTGKDQYGNPCEDSYIDNWVPPKMSVSREFEDHKSVQVWAWGPSGDLLDKCDVDLARSTAIS